MMSCEMKTGKDCKQREMMNCKVLSWEKATTGLLQDYEVRSHSISSLMT